MRYCKSQSYAVRVTAVGHSDIGLAGRCLLIEGRKTKVDIQIININTSEYLYHTGI